MGILDDAIREHLDLKRSLGAREAEVKRLEDEAFGPPARPGEPEFGAAAESGSEASAGAEISAAEVPPAAGDASAPTSEPGDSDGVELRVPPELAVEDADEHSPAEQARLAHPDLEDTDAHVPFADSPDGAASEAPPAEPEADSEGLDVGDLSLSIDDEPAMQIQDAPDTARAADAPPGEPRTDDVDSAPAADAPPGEPLADEVGFAPADVAPADQPHPGRAENVPPADDAGTAPAEDAAPAEAYDPAGAPFDVESLEDEAPAAPIESPEREADTSDDSVVEEADIESESAPPIEPPDPANDDLDDLLVEQAEPEDEPPRVAEPGLDEPGEADEGRDDLLEETPDFLRDAPESDRLWFEQREPQDFDFDDEES